MQLQGVNVSLMLIIVFEKWQVHEAEFSRIFFNKLLRRKGFQNIQNEY